MTVANTAAKTIISGKAASKLVRAHARRVEDAEEEVEDEEYGFLGNYNVKVVGCKSNLEQPLVKEDGEYDYSAVLLRLCPSSGDGCDSETVEGCKDGYGEMLVPVSTFVEAYFEDQQRNQEDENGNGDDDFEIDRLAGCEEYNPDENADDGNKGAWENYQFFIGATCTEDELDLKLELFTDEYCRQVSEIDFGTISNGWTLPYADGGLVSTNCNSCSEYNDNGELELKEMCMESYEQAAYKCEEKMEYYSYYGQNNQGCEMLAEMFPQKSSMSAGKVFGWIIFFVLLFGIGGWMFWWRAKKAASNAASGIDYETS